MPDLTVPTDAGAVGPSSSHVDTGVPAGYSERLCNADLAPLRDQHWGAYNIFAFWMSDVHSVGGYVFAGSLFALGLTSWQVLIALLVGIGIVNVFANLIAKSSQQNGVPYPVICRATFGVLGANIPAVIRGLIAVAWYGIQTYLASSAFVIVLLKFAPQLMPYADVHHHGVVTPAEVAVRRLRVVVEPFFGQPAVGAVGLEQEDEDGLGRND